jgi:citrate synthase
MITDPEQKIARPRQVYVGEAARDVVPIENRVVVATHPAA